MRYQPEKPITPESERSGKMQSLKSALFAMNLQEKAKQLGIDLNASLDEPNHTCEYCEDAGMVKYAVPVGDPRFGKFFPCDQCEKGNALRVESWTRLLRGSGLPHKYRDFSFESWAKMPDDYKQGKKLAFALADMLAVHGDASIAEGYRLNNREYPHRDKVRNSLVLQGPYGVGKTGLAAAIINDRINHNQSSLYIRVDDFLASIRATYDDKAGQVTDSEIIDAVKKAPFLVLDEFYIQKISDFARSTMESVIRYRHGHQLPTVVTCNQTPDEMTNAWGGATIDVLLEMAHWVLMGGQKLRDVNQTHMEDPF